MGSDHLGFLRALDLLGVREGTLLDAGGRTAASKGTPLPRDTPEGHVAGGRIRFELPPSLYWNRHWLVKVHTFAADPAGVFPVRVERGRETREVS